MTAQQIDKDKIDKNIERLSSAVEKTYGSAWSIVWRNFLAGIMRSFGAAFGYVIIAVLLFYIAKKLGILDAMQNFWKSLVDQIENFKQGAPLDSSVLKDFDPTVLKGLE